jgi:hypothetical protein
MPRRRAHYIDTKAEGKATRLLDWGETFGFAEGAHLHPFMVNRGAVHHEWDLR